LARSQAVCRCASAARWLLLPIRGAIQWFPAPPISVHTIRTASSFTSWLYRRVRGSPVACSFGKNAILVSNVRSLQATQDAS
jgi:hypothetical protein